MQPLSRHNLKRPLTWALIRVFALHKNHYGTPRTPVWFRCRDHPADGLRAAVPGIRTGLRTNWWLQA